MSRRTKSDQIQEAPERRNILKEVIEQLASVILSIIRMILTLLGVNFDKGTKRQRKVEAAIEEIVRSTPPITTHNTALDLQPAKESSLREINDRTTLVKKSKLLREAVRRELEARRPDVDARGKGNLERLIAENFNLTMEEYAWLKATKTADLQKLKDERLESIALFLKGRPLHNLTPFGTLEVPDKTREEKFNLLRTAFIRQRRLPSSH
jgi:hypothetical protein